VPDLLEREFGRQVCAEFGLGVGSVRLTPLTASSTRLWALEAAGGADAASGSRFVVKEFPYHDGERPAEVAAAAEFEYSLWRAGDILMPEPMRARDGQLVTWLTGSRGARVPVRAHRWLDGAPVPEPSSVLVAAAAGRALALIHRAGAARPARPGGSVRWWPQEHHELIGPMADRGLLTPGEAAAARDSLNRAEAILSAGDQLAGDWIYTHCDHKPANSLLVGARIAVLDWDECGYCHPRLEVVESALRWAGAKVGEPRSDVARAFLQEYEQVAEIRFGPLTVGDFAKWVAAGAGWFWFTGRRALGWYQDDTAAEQTSAAEMAAWSIETLSRTLASLDRWAQALSDA
jgi:Ser/Thr protein kinase RdoA (MazF antagonist)